MKFTNLDIIEAEPVLELIFSEFIPTDPYSEEFGNLGYDSSNFFLECGPLMFIIMAFIVWAPIRKILQCLTRKCNDNCCNRRLKQNTHFKMSIMIFLIESSIELCLSAYICVYKMTDLNFSELWFGVSTVLAFITLAIQVALPIYLLHAKCKFFKDTQNGVQESYYKDFFSDLSPKNKTGLFYSSVFLARRFRYHWLFSFQTIPSSRHLFISYSAWPSSLSLSRRNHLSIKLRIGKRWRMRLLYKWLPTYLYSSQISATIWVYKRSLDTSCWDW